MSRSMSSGVLSEITASELQPFLMFEGSFISGTVRAWSGIGDLIYGGHTWTGTGTLLTISAVEEVSDVSAVGVTVSLSGVPQELISLALAECVQGAAGKVYLGFLNNEGVVVADPLLMFEGRLDIPSVDEGAEMSIVTITYESRLIDLQRPREFRSTNEDHQREFPGDLAFEFVPKLQDMKIIWGRSS